MRACPLALLLIAAASRRAGANWGECINTCTPENLWSSCACAFYNEATNQMNYASSFDSWQDAYFKVVTCPGTGQYKTWGVNQGLYRTDTTLYLAACVPCPPDQQCEARGCDYSCNNSSSVVVYSTPPPAKSSSARHFTVALLALPLGFASALLLDQ